MSERLLYIGKLPAGRKMCTYLEKAGYEIKRVEGLRPSLRALSEFDPALIILDTNDASPINISRITHTAGRRTSRPFMILLTNNRSSTFADAVYDTILVHPFTPRRLSQKVRKLLDSRRDFVVSVGPLILDRRTHHVQTPSKSITKLTPKQFQLLDYLMMHAGELVTRSELMLEVWETNYLGDTRTLDVHIRWLRERLEKNASKPELIVTIRGKGYKLALEGSPVVGGDPLV